MPYTAQSSLSGSVGQRDNGSSWYSSMTGGTGNYVVQYINYNCQMGVTTGSLSNVYYTNCIQTISAQETAEQVAVRVEAERKRDRDRKEAEKRAEMLLLSCLTDAQQAQYKAHGYFETDVSDKVYRIKKGRTGNVELIDGGKAKYRYCAHPDKWTPDQDVMLSQLLMLKTDEQRFLNTANRTVLRQAA